MLALPCRPKTRVLQQVSGAALPPGETLEVDLAILPVLKQNKVLSGHSSKSMWPFSKHVSIMLYHDPCSKTCKRILPIESQGQAPTCFMRGFQVYLPACQSMPNPCTDCVISQVFVGSNETASTKPALISKPGSFLPVLFPEDQNDHLPRSLVGTDRR